MRKLISLMVGVLCMGLVAACSIVELAVPPAPKTPQQTVYEVKAALVSSEDAGLAWASQICPSASSCQDQRVKTVMQAIVTADTLIDAAETAVKANATATSAMQQAATDAQAALTALQAILTQYGVTASAATTSTKGS